MAADPTPEQAAQRMLAEVRQHGRLYQRAALRMIDEEFGREFLRENERGHLFIGKAVLAAFRKVSGEDVVWERRALCWRLRTDRDLPGREQGSRRAYLKEAERRRQN